MFKITSEFGENKILSVTVWLNEQITSRIFDVKLSGKTEFFYVATNYAGTNSDQNIKLTSHHNSALKLRMPGAFLRSAQQCAMSLMHSDNFIFTIKNTDVQQ